MESSRILETKQLKAGKSTYIIDLVQHKPKSLFIEIFQSIASSNIDGGSVKIHPDVVMSLIKTLQEFQIQILLNEPNELKNIPPFIKDKIQKSYFDMVEIEDIAMQQGLTKETVKAILDERGIEIVSHKKPVKKYWKRRK